MIRSQGDTDEFKRAVLDYYARHARDLPWRRTRDPFAILVSEVMLQQTQVTRVRSKFDDFLRLFPNPRALAHAAVADVLSAWQGLGYNRRALALHRTAAILDEQYGGVVPETAVELRRFPGIGPATAAAVCVYAFDQPLVFVETNIRSAFIHFFFQECPCVSDAELLPLIESTLDRENPREWYHALMDYGAWIKKTDGNPNRKSRQFVVQAPFAGSRRQARGAVLRALLEAGASGLRFDELGELPELSTRPVAEVASILSGLCEEGFIAGDAMGYRVA
jgi:A/G-specific adenine glycosylase